MASERENRGWRVTTVTVDAVDAVDAVVVVLLRASSSNCGSTANLSATGGTAGGDTDTGSTCAAVAATLLSAAELSGSTPDIVCGCTVRANSDHAISTKGNLTLVSSWSVQWSTVAVVVVVVANTALSCTRVAAAGYEKCRACAYNHPTLPPHRPSLSTLRLAYL